MYLICEDVRYYHILIDILTNYNQFMLFTIVKQCCLSSTVAVADLKIDHLIESILSL